MKENSNRLLKTQKLTVTSILAAIVIVISFLPLKTLGLEISFAMVPVAIGAILYGPEVGAILGAAFGTVSFLQCFGYSAFGALLLNENWFDTLIVCLPTRVIAGFLTGVIFKAISKAGKNGTRISYPVTALAAPLLNTLMFMSALVLLFYRCGIVQNYVKLLGAANPFVFVVLFVGINGVVEIIAGFVVAYPAARALNRALKIQQ